MKIASIALDHPVGLAPMAGMTDTAFRRLVKRQGGCGLVVTEMVSSEGLVRGIDRTLEFAETDIFGFRQPVVERIGRARSRKCRLRLAHPVVDRRHIDLVQDLLNSGVGAVDLIDDHNRRKIQFEGLFKNKPCLR